MKIEISLLIALSGVLLSAITVYVAIKRNTKTDTKDVAEKEATEKLIEYQLKELKEDVKKILDKLDYYDKDIDDRINKALHHHCEVYHKDV